ncbi:MAG: carbohydrate kinase, partial [Clostridia bacterium]
FVALGKTGEREFSFARKPGADACLTVDELDRTLLVHTKIFHTGSLSLTQEPSRSATLRAIEIAKNAGALISYDPNYRASLWKHPDEAMFFMRSLIQTADLMKLSDEETVLLTGEHDPVLASKLLVDAGVKAVAITLGSKGALVRVGNEFRNIPGFSVHAVDTTGAGDAFFGAFLYSFLKHGGSLEGLTVEIAADCARFGNAAASLCIEHRGGIPAMPSLAEIEIRLGD